MIVNANECLIETTACHWKKVCIGQSMISITWSYLFEKDLDHAIARQCCASYESTLITIVAFAIETVGTRNQKSVRCTHPLDGRLRINVPLMWPRLFFWSRYPRTHSLLNYFKCNNIRLFVFLLLCRFVFQTKRLQVNLNTYEKAIQSVTLCLWCDRAHTAYSIRSPNTQSQQPASTLTAHTKNKANETTKKERKKWNKITQRIIQGNGTNRNTSDVREADIFQRPTRFTLIQLSCEGPNMRYVFCVCARLFLACATDCVLQTLTRYT